MANQQSTASSWMEEDQNICDNNNCKNQSQNVMTMSRAPFECPISGCDCMVGCSLMLSHYLRDHTNAYEDKFRELNLGMKQTLVFDPSQLEFGKNYCLGVLMYGGQAEDKSSRPATRGLSVPNSMLPQNYEKFDAHLPVLIMVCRTTWVNLLQPVSVVPSPRVDPSASEVPSPSVHPSANVTPSSRVLPLPSVLPSISEQPSDDRDDSAIFVDNSINELIVIWLASLQTTKPIYCTIKVYDKGQHNFRGKMMQLRPLSDSQKPKDFALDAADCMRLTQGEINILSQKRKSDIGMEIVFDEPKNN